MTEKRKTGNLGEDAVIRKMCMEGFTFVARNFTVHNMGELDVVMEKEGEIYVVEVKSRLENTYYASPEKSIPRSKRLKIQRTTSVLLSRLGKTDVNVHFLAGCVTHRRDGMIQNVEIIPF